MIQTIRSAWKVQELRNKLLFTIFALLIFRVGSAIPVPFIDTESLKTYMASQSSSIFGLLNVMSGDAFAQATVFALSIQPYINSSIIVQLLTIAIPALEKMARDEGEEGKKKIAAITRYATVAIALLQAFGYYKLISYYELVADGLWPAFVIIFAFTAGSAFLMWLGEQITEFGIGNGISILLFAGIVSRFPQMVTDSISGVSTWNSLHSGAITEETLTEAGMTAEQAQQYIQSLQASAVVFPNAHMKQVFDKFWMNMDIHRNNAFSLTAMQAAFNEGEEWLDQLLPYLSDNFDFVVDYCKKHIPQIKTYAPDATYLMWLDCRDLGLSNEELRTFMIEKAKLGFNEGWSFGRSLSGYMRLNAACPRSILEQAMKQLEAAVRSL